MSGPITGTDGNDNLIGTTADDIIDALGGDDRIDGGRGADTMTGGTGDDTFLVDTQKDIVIEGLGGGIDTVLLTLRSNAPSTKYTLADNVENLVATSESNARLLLYGNALDNRITAGDGNDYLSGLGGTDTMLGGLGDDNYVVDRSDDKIIEKAGAGNDNVIAYADYVLPGNVEILSLIGGVKFGTGNALDNQIYGSNGDNVIDGGRGADRMYGYAGNDIYFVDNVGDVIDETGTYGGAGKDTVNSSISYTLTEAVENLVLTGIASLSGTGNTLINRISGNIGNNTLDGVGGGDTLLGGLGNDTYIVHAGDKLIELAGEGIDTVRAEGSYTLATNFERLFLTGTAGATLTGNAADNVIVGNAGADIIDGGEGADVMMGGGGMDTYVVDNVGDKVIETADGDKDTVLSSISYILSGNLENLTLTGTGAINATGNGQYNTLTGNDAANVIDGGRGRDVMIGKGGDDIYIVDDGNDTVQEDPGGGTDTVRSSLYATYLSSSVERLELTGAAKFANGNELDNVITGTDRDNVIAGGAGADRMIGAGGNDSYTVDNTGDRVVELADGGTDKVIAVATWTMSANVENLDMLGSDNINATGNDLANLINGNEGNNVLSGRGGNDVLNGGGGVDTLIGGTGDDTFIVNFIGDTVVERAGEGTDTVIAGASYALSANVENLVLKPFLAFNGTGNALDNTITGNDSSNTLDGGLGADRLIGGAGSDRYFIDNAGDTIVDSAGAGDTAITSISYVAARGIEIIATFASRDPATGAFQPSTADLNLTGNSADNFIDGTTGANVLVGGAGYDIIVSNGGADTINGGLGNDTLVGLDSSGRIKGGDGADTFVFGLLSAGATGGAAISDFATGTDKLEIITDGLAPALADGPLDAANFVFGTSAADTDDVIIYDEASGKLWLDADGSGSGEQQLIALLGAGTELALADITLISRSELDLQFSSYYGQIMG
ncbi:calcium-binding protein [Novosphingobium sp.]|uniref:beta strand repeat-containing protein n=1 Tax=Novosphingobium sp. TaxID=1874826 RepID=UPI002624142A|nr:calcium-binding protein [Novosphingobium sp.]